MKKTLSKLLALLLICALALSLAACGGSKTPEAPKTDSTPEPAKTEAPKPAADSTSKVDTTKDSVVASTDAPKAAKDTMIATLTSDSGTLDPQFNIGWDCMGVLRCIYEPLFDLTEDKEVIWVLATGIDYVEPTHWVVHLREGVKFANGNPFTAEDAVFTIYRACNRPGASSLLTRVLADELNVIDDYTFDVYFDQYEVGMEVGTWPSIYMFDKESFSEDTVATETMGTGPYKLTKMVTNSQWVIERRDDYWGEKPAMREITFNFLSEATQRVNALETNSTDYTPIEFQDLEYCKAMPGRDVILHGSGYAKSIYTSNADNSIFYENTDARKAVAYAIDREGIVAIAYGGNATVSRLPFAMGKDDQQDEWLDQGVYGEGQNIELAKQLAESSGLTSRPITLVNNGAADSMACCELIQEDLRAIGVDCEIITSDAGSWFTYIFDATMWDMAIDFSMGDTVLQALNRMNGIGGGQSYNKFPWTRGDEFHELLDGAKGNPDEAQRIEDTTKMLDIIQETYLWLALCDIYNAYVINSDLRGFSWSRSGQPAYWNLYWTE